MLLLITAIPAHAADAASEQAKLSGAWTAVEAQRDGSAAKEDIGHRLEFIGDRFAISAGGKTIYSGTYTLNTSAQPAQIDFRHLEGEAKGLVWEGIYQLEGSTLVVCDDAFDTAQSRPTTFTTAKGSGHVMITFRRS